MAEVELRQVCKRYPDGTEVLRALDLTLSDRELVVLVGPSGCGKSTTLRLVAGLEELTGGTVFVDGRRVDHLPPRDRDVAMVFQSYALYPQMTVFDNMAFALTLRKRSRSEILAQVGRAAAVLGLEPLLQRYPRQLSGGQRQRVALGRALVRNPKCFLFDEPLSNLDAKLRTETRTEIKRLHQELGSTTLYVTHDQEEAMTLSDRLVVMDAGVVRQSGPPLELYERPADRFVAGFLGTPAMSFVEGQLVAAESHIWLDDGSQRLKLAAMGSGDGAGKLDAWLGARVVLGVRPSAIKELGSANQEVSFHQGALRARVVLVEPLGTRMNVHLQLDSGARVVLEQEARAGIAVGNWVTGNLDPRRLHLFELGTHGKALPALA